jgi:DNA-binding LacI/PurR family transcriptional regulator
MKVTIKDVASRAGVSISTVSRVLNNMDIVNSKTRENVEDVIKQLNFSPDNTARSMIKKESKSIGLILPTLANEYWSEMTEIILRELWKHGYTLTLYTTGRSHDPAKITATIKETMNIFANRMVDGIIWGASMPPVNQGDGLLADFYKSNIPLVLIDHNINGISRVSGDHVNGAMTAVNHLMELGHREIFSLQSLNEHDQRELGYINAHIKNNITVNKNLIAGIESSTEAGYSATKKAISAGKHFTAMFCWNDLQAIGAINAIQDMGLDVPGDISVVGYDDISIAKLIKPGLTTISQPKQAIGNTVVELMMESIRHKGIQFVPREIIFHMELVIRNSCGKPKHKNRKKEKRTKEKI